MTETRAKQLEETARAAGVRVTRQRAALLRVLADSADHPDVLDGFAGLPALARSWLG